MAPDFGSSGISDSLRIPPILPNKARKKKKRIARPNRITDPSPPKLVPALSRFSEDPPRIPWRILQGFSRDSRDDSDRSWIPLQNLPRHFEGSLGFLWGEGEGEGEKREGGREGNDTCHVSLMDGGDWPRNVRTCVAPLLHLPPCLSHPTPPPASHLPPPPRQKERLK